MLNCSDLTQQSVSTCSIATTRC